MTCEVCHRPLNPVAIMLRYPICQECARKVAVKPPPSLARPPGTNQPQASRELRNCSLCQRLVSGECEAGHRPKVMYLAQYRE